MITRGFSALVRTCLLLLVSAPAAVAEPVFSRELQRAAVLAGRLAEQVDNPFVNSGEWESLTYYRTQPDGVILARKEGWCFVAFQATVDGLDNFYQLVEPGFKEVCALDDASACCKTRIGTHRGYFTDYTDEFHRDLEECFTEYCQDPADCVVLSGISQGASEAAIASVILRKYDPWVFLYGLIPSLFPECTHFNPERMMIFVNSGICPLMWWRWLVYDFPWPIRSRGEVNRGYVYVLGEDPSAFVSLGLDAGEFDRGTWLMTIMGFAAHALRDEREFCGFDGYVERMEKTYDLYNNRSPDSPSFPVNVYGYKAGAPCTRWFECYSGDCELSPRGTYYPGKCL